MCQDNRVRILKMTLLGAMIMVTELSSCECCGLEGTLMVI